MTLRDIALLIWRRIQVWEDTTRAQLHRILQIAVGWENYPLHGFHIGRRVYGVPDPDDERTVIDERRQRMRVVVPRLGAALEYVYDFGDPWQHELLLEAVVLPEPEQQYPRCLAGERSGPPEDVGGPFGYANCREAIADCDPEEHADRLEWRGPFDSELFSLAAVNRRLQRKSRQINVSVHDNL